MSACELLHYWILLKLAYWHYWLHHWFWIDFPEVPIMGEWMKTLPSLRCTVGTCRQNMTSYKTNVLNDSDDSVERTFLTIRKWLTIKYNRTEQCIDYWHKPCELRWLRWIIRHRNYPTAAFLRQMWICGGVHWELLKLANVRAASRLRISPCNKS